ncbi:cytochrome P450 [Paenibacillus sp. CAU 1523]|uniref:Bifunctional cytochrome P450/NADPH--P450 reductase n=1 Tax=Paenibacillus arenosi TaxID=2774142 RepID=A0ABR9B1C8_9BACL|nr:cytochrome P450 [Paenibacillus arenosi]
MIREAGYIPQPKSYGPLGNLPLINKDTPILSLGELAEKHGPIYRFKAPGISTLMVSGHKLVAELCDITRFDKYLGKELLNVRAFGGDGLFTSWTTEPNWRKAHNILLPTFGQQAMKGYHTMMVDIASQLIQKWARLNPNDTIDVADDMTRLTLDTIGLCGFNYRFNSFYREEHSPFILSMVRALNEAMRRSNRIKLQNMLMVKTRMQYEEDIQTMFALVDKIIEERKTSGGSGEIDLLARMLEGRDPDTGERLDDENIRYQIITFLIAGHETTSGLLSFALYFLLKNPDALEKAYQEVDQVLTSPTPTYEQVLQLKYIRMILNEALRLWPTAPGFEVSAREDTVIGGEYSIKKGDNLVVLLPQLHRDKDAWGEDAEQFRPERFEDPAKVPNHAYKPFGNGERACIGMQFAMHEAILALGMILKHFEMIDYRNYQLKIKETLTLKPDEFSIRVKQREHKESASMSSQQWIIGNATVSTEVNLHDNVKEEPVTSKDSSSILVLYGSNLGTAEGIARELANTARVFGIRSEVASLNESIGKLPQDSAVIIVTASYNGKPPRNAAQFVKWLEEIEDGELEGVQYAVFGCGDRNWSNTYQDVPRFIDEQLARKGAKRISSRGEADASGDFEQQLELWRETLWTEVRNCFGINDFLESEPAQNALHVQFVNRPAAEPLVRTYDAFYATVVDNRELQSAISERSTRHIEIQLPQGIAYREGDHIGVLPRNSKENVDRVLRRFRLQGDDQLILTSNGLEMAHFPMNQPVNIRDLLSHSVEMQEPATRAQIRELAAHTVCPPHQRELEALLDEDVYQEQVLSKRLSMLTLVEKYEACELPFVKFLELLPPLKPRYYSISSSPRKYRDKTSITVAVVNGPARCGNGEYKGVSSTSLALSKPGEELLIFIRTPESGFQLPEDPMVPLVMVGPGTGLAPFRGFLQARSALKESGVMIGEAHLYFGCRNELDFIYREELEQYEREGIVTLHTAFSRIDEASKTYVQHLMERNAPEIIHMVNGTGRLYICGDGSNMAPDVEAMLRQAYCHTVGASDEEAIDWLNELQAKGRYAKDVWASA